MRAHPVLRREAARPVGYPCRHEACAKSQGKGYSAAEAHMSAECRAASEAACLCLSLRLPVAGGGTAAIVAAHGAPQTGRKGRGSVPAVKYAWQWLLALTGGVLAGHMLLVHCLGSFSSELTCC